MVLTSFFYADDRIRCGEVFLPENRDGEPERGNYEKVLYVAEGDLRRQSRRHGAEPERKPGDMIFIPPNVTHSYEAIGIGPARALVADRRRKLMSFRRPLTGRLRPAEFDGLGRAMKARIGIDRRRVLGGVLLSPVPGRHPDVELVGVVRRNREALAALQATYELEVASDSVDELLAAGCDGVIVASPHNLHREHAVAAMEAGAHVLVEKPMTVTLADSLALERRPRETGRKIVVAYGWNFAAMTTWASDLVADGADRRPALVTGVMSSSLVDLFSGRAATESSRSAATSSRRRPRPGPIPRRVAATSTASSPTNSGLRSRSSRPTRASSSRARTFCRAASTSTSR